jgi:hypothetical protein
MWHVWAGEKFILESNRLLGRPRRRWEYNIKIGFQEIGWLKGTRNTFVYNLEYWKVTGWCGE